MIKLHINIIYIVFWHFVYNFTTCQKKKLSHKPYGFYFKQSKHFTEVTAVNNSILFFLMQIKLKIKREWGDSSGTRHGSILYTANQYMTVYIFL
jgi:hypothetical protein